MRVTVRYFAVLRERRGVPVEEVDLPEACTVAAAYAHIGLPAGLRVAFAVNETVVPQDTALHAGDDLAFLPPLGGG